MASAKFSISTSEELFQALESLQERREQDRSSLVEMLLREHPMIRREIRRQRGQARRRRERGRDAEELASLARTARRQWDKREEAGEVELLDR